MQPIRQPGQLLEPRRLVLLFIHLPQDKPQDLRIRLHQGTLPLRFLRKSSVFLKIQYTASISGLRQARPLFRFRECELILWILRT